MKKITIIGTLLVLLFTRQLYAQKIFNDLDSFLKYAGEKSTSLQSGKIKIEQARKAKLAAIVGIAGPSGNLSFTYTNNTRLGVNLFPSEVLGGTPGTYTPVTMGVQYNSYFNQYAEIKLLNPEGWENFRSSKLNQEATISDHQLTRKSLYEDMAATYFNVVQLQEQMKVTEENLLASDTLLKIAVNKYELGQLKRQDVNDAKVNYLNTQENVNQIRFQIQQQYTTLKILADIPENDSIAIRQVVSVQPIANTAVVEYNQLSRTNSLLKEKLAQSTFRQNKFSRLPTFSVFLSNTRQQYNTNPRLFDDRVDWIPSSYVGFKVALPLPTAKSASAFVEAHYNYQLARQNTEHARIKEALDHQQLRTDYAKSWSQYVTNQEVYELKKDSYQKNLNLYSQGLLDTEQTLNSFNAMVNSRYELISAAVEVLWAQAKIDINNTIK